METNSPWDTPSRHIFKLRFTTREMPSLFFCYLCTGAVQTPSSVQSLGKNFHLNPGNLGVVWIALKVDYRFSCLSFFHQSLEHSTSWDHSEDLMRNSQAVNPRANFATFTLVPEHLQLRKMGPKKFFFCIENLRQLHKPIFVSSWLLFRLIISFLWDKGQSIDHKRAVEKESKDES